MNRQVNFNLPISSQIDNKKNDYYKPLRNIKKFYYYISKRIDNFGYYIFCI